MVGVGLFIGCAEVIVLTDDAEEDLAGELGRRDGTVAGDNGGMDDGTNFPLGVDVGMTGVEAELGVVADEFGIGPVYRSPSSPGANMTTEQNPSVDVISSVRPSEDLENDVLA